MYFTTLFICKLQIGDKYKFTSYICHVSTWGQQNSEINSPKSWSGGNLFPEASNGSEGRQYT